LYSFNTKGSVIDGIFLPADPDGTKTTCASSVYYWPKGVPTPTPAPSPTSTSTAPTPTSTEDKGTLQVWTAAGANVGCILSKGTWSQQTCATFRPVAGSAPGTITLNHSKGPCAVATNGTLACGAAVTVGSDFTSVSSLVPSG
jgi:ribonuclease T2